MLRDHLFLHPSQPINITDKTMVELTDEMRAAIKRVADAHQVSERSVLARAIMPYCKRMAKPVQEPSYENVVTLRNV